MMGAWEVFRLFGTIETGRDKFDADMSAMDKRVHEFATRVGGAFQNVGKSLTLRVTAPIVAAGAAAVKFGADFEAAMTESLAIMGDVSDAMRTDMAGTARQVAMETTASATDAAKAYFYLASAGLDAAQSIAALPAVAKFAQAGAFDLALATDLLTDAQSALGLTVDNTAQNIENMVRVSDVLVKANVLANATVQQFSEALTNRAAAALRLLNKDIEEGVAVLAVYADQGVKGAQAGEQLSIVLRDLQRASIDNRKEFNSFGISVFDASGKMRSIADILEGMEKAFAGMSDETLRATLMTLGFQDRSVSAMMVLLGTSKQLREYERALRDAGGITDEVAKKQLDSLTAQLKLLKNQLVDVGIDLADVLIPILRNHLVPQLQAWLKWLKALSPEMKVWALGIAAVAAALGPLLYLVGQFIVMLPALKVQLVGLAAWMRTPTGIIVTLGLLAAGFLLARNAARDFQQVFETPAGRISKLTGEMAALEKRLETIHDLLDPKKAIWLAPGEEAALKKERAEILAQIAAQTRELKPLQDAQRAEKEMADALAAAQEALEDAMRGASGAAGDAKKTALELALEQGRLIETEYELAETITGKLDAAKRYYTWALATIDRFKNGTLEEREAAAALAARLGDLTEAVIDYGQETGEAAKAQQKLEEGFAAAAEAAEAYGRLVEWATETTGLLDEAAQQTGHRLMGVSQAASTFPTAYTALEEVERRLRDIRELLYGGRATLSEETRSDLEREMLRLEGWIADYHSRIEEDVEDTTGRYEDYWLSTLRNVKSAFSDLIYGLMDGTKDWSDFFQEMTNIIRRMWADMIADMVTQWIANLLDLPSPQTSGGGGGLLGVIGSILGLAQGAIVTSPSLAMIAEAGVPEAVIPLNQPAALAAVAAAAGAGSAGPLGAGMGNAVHFHEGAIKYNAAGMSEWDLYMLARRLKTTFSDVLLEGVGFQPAW